MQEITDFFNQWGVWGWMSIGVLLMIAELFIPGTFVMWFGFGALMTGLIVGLVGTVSISMQLLIFVIMSVISVVLGFYVYRRIFGANKQKGGNPKVGAQKYIGKTFVVVETIKNGKGKVAVGDTVWIALCDKKVPKDAEVKVIGVDGIQLIVEPK